jgi:hypothetical protein
MSERKFVVAVLAAAIGFSPLILFSWIWLVATVDFGDVLAVLCVLVVQYEIGKLRKEERATYRAIRRAEVRKINAEPWPTPPSSGEFQESPSGRSLSGRLTARSRRSAVIWNRLGEFGDTTSPPPARSRPR